MGHLSFTEILDTSLKVSWQEPVEKNGIITGKYQLPSPFFFFLSMHGVWCIIAVQKCLCNRAFRENWLLWALFSWSLFWIIEMSAWARYRKSGSNYWQLMIVVTEKAVPIRNQLPMEFLVLLNPPWPPPVLLNFWNFGKLCPSCGGVPTWIYSCKIWIGIAKICNQDQAWNQCCSSTVIKWSGCGLCDRIYMSLFNFV